MSTPIEPQVKSKRNVLAIASLILGILAIAFAQFCFTPGLYSVLGCLGGIAALFAVAAGVMGVRAARTLAGQGQRPAVAGIVTAVLSLLFLVVVFIPTMLTPGGFWNLILATPVPTATPTPTVTPTPVPTATPLPTTTPTPAPQTYNGDGFTLMFPGDWLAIDTSDDEFCQGPDVECLSLVHSISKIELQIVRQTLDERPDVEREDQRLLAQLESADLVSEGTMEVDGQPGIMRRLVLQSSAGPIHIFYVLVANEYDLYSFLAFSPSEDLLTEYQAEIEEIVASTRFTPPAPIPSATPIPSPQTYYGDGFTLTFPGDWLELDTSDIERCSPSNVTCFLIVHSAEDGPQFFLARETHDDKPDLETLDQEAWDQYEGSANLMSKETIEVAGLPAIRRTFVKSSPNSPSGGLYYLQVIVVNEYDEYGFTAVALTADTFLRYQVTMNEIIASLQFTQ